MSCLLLKRKRAPLSCGLRRSKVSSANRIWPAWRQRVASYRLRRSSAIVGQIGEAQKATREVSGGIDARFDGFRPRVGYGFCSVRHGVRCRIKTDWVSPPEQRIDNFARGRDLAACLNSRR